MGEIRLPDDVGIAGSVFQSRDNKHTTCVCIFRFNPAFDKKTGYFTRSILCVPIMNKDGICIGCTQVLNKSGGIFY